jgi:hypothetical protein
MMYTHVYSILYIVYIYIYFYAALILLLADSYNLLITVSLIKLPHRTTGFRSHETEQTELVPCVSVFLKLVHFHEGEKTT